MNLLRVVLNWYSLQNDIVVKDGYFSHGTVSLYTQRIANKDRPIQGFVFNKERGILCGAIGYISNISILRKQFSLDGNLDDINVIAELYAKEQELSFPLIEGLFTIFIWDFNKKKGYIFQDDNGFYTPLFYAKNKEGFIFCNSLKILLKNSKLTRSLNLQAVQDFLYTGIIIPNESTLVEGVYKLLPGQIIILDSQAMSMKIGAIKRKVKRVSSDTARKQLILSIEEEIERLFSMIEKTTVGLTLSSGFDSNLILFYLNKRFPNNIVAITIGGKKINEIPVASQCVAIYKGVKHVKSVIADGRLQNLPDIVWRTEGAVFEHGLFLQNELAKTCKTERISVIFLGECADQQLDPFRKIGGLNLLFRLAKKHLKPIALARRIFCLLKQRHIQAPRSVIYDLQKPKQIFAYDIDKDYILKKNGILMNSYGIQPVYPFLNRKTMILAKSLRPGESNKKRFYIEEVKRKLGPALSQYLKKMGGTTDIEYLCYDKNALLEKLWRKNFIKKILPKLTYKKYIEFLQDNVHTSFFVQLLYIYLFNELFITGKYDNFLSESGINFILDDFFN